jgi:hypothetical protein
MSDDEQYVDLNIERRGTHFALVRRDGVRQTEIELLESDILSLARVFPSYARELKARRSRREPGISAWTAIPVDNYAMNADLHHQLVLLKIQDANEAEFEFSLEPIGARQLAESLIDWARRVEKAPKITRQ